MPARILYVSQSATLKTNDGTTYNLPVQSANCEVSRPIEDVFAFGRLGSLGRVQNNVSTCKSDLKVFLHNSTGESNNNTLSASLIGKLTGDALDALTATITVTPNGFAMSGILTNLGIDVALGSFATADLSFAGVGEPYFASPPGASEGNTEASLTTVTSVNPVNTANVSGSSSLGCANSIKFSLDLPNDVIGCLGSDPSGTQVAVASNYIMSAKPPFKSTMTVEGAGAEPTNAIINQTFYFGKLGIAIPNPLVTNRSFNQAVGNVAANYNYTIEGITATFSAASP